MSKKGQSTAVAIQPRGALAVTRAQFPENQNLVLEATKGLKMSNAASLCDEKEVLAVRRALDAAAEARNDANRVATEKSVLSGTEVAPKPVDALKAVVRDRSFRTAAKDLLASKVGDGAQFINLPTPVEHPFSTVLYDALRALPKMLPRKLAKEGYEIPELLVRFVGGEAHEPLPLFNKEERDAIAASINQGGDADDAIDPELRVDETNSPDSSDGSQESPLIPV